MPVLRLEWLWDFSSVVCAERLSNVYMTSEQRKPVQSLLAISLPQGFSNTKWKMLSESNGHCKHRRYHATTLLAVAILSNVCFFIEENRGFVAVWVPTPSSRLQYIYLYICGGLPPPHSKLEFGKWFRDLGKHSNVIHGRKHESDSLTSSSGERRTDRTEVPGHNERQPCRSSCWALWVEGHTLASVWLPSV